MQFIGMGLIGRSHSPIEAEQFFTLTVPFPTHPAITALDKIIGCLTLILFQLIARNIGSKPMYPDKPACHRLGVFIL